MKNKIILSAIALIGFAASSNAQTSDDASANASARIVPAISITNERHLDFGNIIRATGGTVIIDATSTGTRSKTGSVLLAPGLTSSAEFEVVGDGAATYSITRLPAVATPLVLTNINTAATMNATLVVSTDDDAGVESATGVLSGTTGTNGSQFVYVGGELTVAAAQAYGTYQNVGGITITVDYN